MALIDVGTVNNSCTPVQVSSPSSYISTGAQRLLSDDMQCILYDVEGKSTDGKMVGVILRLAYKNPTAFGTGSESNPIRVYEGRYKGVNYTMTCWSNALNRLDYAIRTS